MNKRKKYKKKLIEIIYEKSCRHSIKYIYNFFRKISERNIQTFHYSILQESKFAY